MRTTSTSVHPPSELAAKLRRFARAHWRLTSSLVAEAVQLAARQEAGQTAILRRLDQLEARIERTMRGGVENKEIVLWFVRVWLEHNPPVDDDLEDTAVATAAERFERFIDYVADSLNAERAAAPVKPRTAPDDVNGATP